MGKRPLKSGVPQQVVDEAISRVRIDESGTLRFCGTDEPEVQGLDVVVGGFAVLY